VCTFQRERGNSLGKNGFYRFDDVIGNPISYSRESGIERTKEKKIFENTRERREINLSVRVVCVSLSLSNLLKALRVCVFMT